MQHHISFLFGKSRLDIPLNLTETQMLELNNQLKDMESGGVIITRISEVEDIKLPYVWLWGGGAVTGWFNVKTGEAGVTEN